MRETEPVVLGPLYRSDELDTSLRGDGLYAHEQQEDWMCCYIRQVGSSPQAGPDHSAVAERLQVSLDERLDTVEQRDTDLSIYRSIERIVRLGPFSFVE